MGEEALSSQDSDAGSVERGVVDLVRWVFWLWAGLTLEAR